MSAGTTGAYRACRCSSPPCRAAARLARHEASCRKPCRSSIGYGQNVPVARMRDAAGTVVTTGLIGLQVRNRRRRGAIRSADRRRLALAQSARDRPTAARVDSGAPTQRGMQAGSLHASRDPPVRTRRPRRNAYRTEPRRNRLTIARRTTAPRNDTSSELML